MASLCGIKIGHFSFQCLGVPLFKGTPRRVHLQGISDSILAKFDWWRGKHLSMAGMVFLVNSTIYSSFIHSFMIYKWPKSLLNYMEKKILNFIWTGFVS